MSKFTLFWIAFVFLLLIAAMLAWQHGGAKNAEHKLTPERYVVPQG